ncbi:nucleoprotein [andere Heimat virus 1]|uniref:Nucleoprotein n=1 Tax=andere Heimat virus 1 TaxID=2847049 RepID=A0A6C0PIK7_9VIRU|nr:nucleoprotein [andere Heimat virus 1]QHX39768.1 nucleoprotein [andere Heimat virus 1]QHX39780.1 nucleoprotein [andere Heimat virus 1]
MEKDLSYESIKYIHKEFGIDVEIREELKTLYDRIDLDIIQRCNAINRHFKAGGTTQEVATELISLNSDIRKLHTEEFVEEAKQKPIIISTLDFTIQEIAELKQDIKTMKQKSGVNTNNKTGTKEGWDKFVMESITDMMIFIETGFLDEKFLRKHNNGTLAGHIAKMHGMTEHCKEAATKFKTIDPEIFNQTEIVGNEMLTNQLQVDYIFVMTYLAKKNAMSLEKLIELCDRCGILFNKMPFTKKVLFMLSKSPEYSILLEIDDDLKLHDSPFRLNRSRFQAAVSAITGCVSDRMITGNPIKIIKTIIELKHKDSVTVSDKPNSTTTYELLLHSTLTTPDTNSKIKNRTKVQRNGLNTVKFIDEADETKSESSSIYNPDFTKQITDLYPQNIYPYEAAGSIEKSNFNADLICSYLDIEGSPEKPVEVGIVVFTKSGNKSQFYENVIYSDKPSDTYISEKSYCHGIDLTIINNSPKCSDTIHSDAKKLLSKIEKVHCFGDDVIKFLKLCDFKGKIWPIELPKWSDRLQRGYGTKLQSKCCNKEEIHSSKLKAKDKDIKEKLLPHCAVTDCFMMHNYLYTQSTISTHV